MVTVHLIALQWQGAIGPVGGGRTSGDVSAAGFLFEKRWQNSKKKYRPR